MHGKYYTVEVPIQELGNGETPFSDADVLFGWTAFEIPRGAACLKSIQIAMKGTNGADANKHDIELYFAKSINGIAPSSFGTLNDAITEDDSAAYRRNIIGHKYIDASERSDDEDLIAYNVWGAGVTTAASTSVSELILEGEPSYAGTQGYQTIWVAGIAKDAFDFGTAVALNNSPANQAQALLTETTLTTSGTDPRHVFQVGDEVIAQDGAEIGKITAVVNATSIKVDQVKAALENADTINWKYPLEFIFGFEY